MNRRKVIFVIILVLFFLAGSGGRFFPWWFAGVRSDRSAPDRARNNAPFIMSPDAVVQAMIELADVREDDVVYDLGCGDGRIVITASVLRGCRGIGFDIDPARVAESRINAQRHQVADRVSFEERDIFTVDLSQATMVMMYLLPQLQEDLIPQLKQMKPGSRIISHCFGLGELHDLPPDKTVEVQVDENTQNSVHLWISPLKLPAASRNQGVDQLTTDPGRWERDGQATRPSRKKDTSGSDAQDTQTEERKEEQQFGSQPVSAPPTRVGGGGRESEQEDASVANQSAFHRPGSVVAGKNRACGSP